MSKRRHPEQDVLSADEHKIVEAGREALRSLGRRTFDHWMVIGRGIKVLRAKAVGSAARRRFGAFSHSTAMTASTTASSASS